MNVPPRPFALPPLRALAALVALGLTLAACGAKGQSRIRIEDAYARETIGTARTGAVYLRVINSGTAEDVLTAAASPRANRIEIHTTGMQDGVMRMRRIDTLPVPAGGSVAFEPGGLHLMLFGLTQPLQAGTRFPLTLTFEKAGAVPVEVTVRSLAQSLPGAGHGPTPDHSDMNHPGMNHPGVDHSGMDHSTPDH